mmetsp:Transcript_10143/g.30065  ORF Transcript_10143/g.30065 Transcript_10143/m.30065 type:complete len:355 (-) Transcript_10143:681-1745(-)
MANIGSLSQKLDAADIERRKEEEARRQREQKMEIERAEKIRKRQHYMSIPDSQPVGSMRDFMYDADVEGVLRRLDETLIGLQPVKDRIKNLAHLLIVDQMRSSIDLETSIPSLHMCFTGQPGTGKTTVACRIGELLAQMGYCRQGHVVVATRDDLVGQYVGHTAPKTKEVIKKSMGGVLLIDEAYYLYNAANNRDYGQESIEILLNVMENQQDDLVVVFAGYKDRMEKFFGYIPGMASRVGNHIDFPNYGPQELVQIAELMANEMQYKLAPDAMPVFQEYISLRMNKPYFSNARTVRNAMDLARKKMALRLFEKATSPMGGGRIIGEELVTLTGADFAELLHQVRTATDDTILA